MRTPRALPLFGGLVVLIGSFLPWGGPGDQGSAYTFALSFLWTGNPVGVTPISVGTVLLVAGLGAAALSFTRQPTILTMAGGWITLVVTLVFVGQALVAALAPQSGTGELFRSVGIGVYPTVLGGVLLSASRG